MGYPHTSLSTLPFLLPGEWANPTLQDPNPPGLYKVCSVAPLASLSPLSFLQTDTPKMTASLTSTVFHSSLLNFFYTIIQFILVIILRHSFS